MFLTKVFPKDEYPIYQVADILKCGPATVMRLIEKYDVPTFKRNWTCFICQAEIIKLLELPYPDCEKYLAIIKQNHCFSIEVTP